MTPRAAPSFSFFFFVFAGCGEENRSHGSLCFFLFCFRGVWRREPKPWLSLSLFPFVAAGLQATQQQKRREHAPFLLWEGGKKKTNPRAWVYRQPNMYRPTYTNKHTQTIYRRAMLELDIFCYDFARKVRHGVLRRIDLAKTGCSYQYCNAGEFFSFFSSFLFVSPNFINIATWAGLGKRLTEMGATLGWEGNNYCRVRLDRDYAIRFFHGEVNFYALARRGGCTVARAPRGLVLEWFGDGKNFVKVTYGVVQISIHSATERPIPMYFRGRAKSTNSIKKKSPTN